MLSSMITGVRACVHECDHPSNVHLFDRVLDFLFFYCLSRDIQVPHALNLAGARPNHASLLALFDARRRSIDSCVWPLGVLGAGSFWHSEICGHWPSECQPFQRSAATELVAGLALTHSPTLSRAYARLGRTTSHVLFFVCALVCMEAILSG
jgi:hypothetical protein